MFRKLKEKIRRQKLIEVEVLETLSSICLYLEFDAHFAHRGRYDDYFSSHKSLTKRITLYNRAIREAEK